MSNIFPDITPNKLARGRDISLLQDSLSSMTGSGGITVDFDGTKPRVRQESAYGAEACGPFTPTVRRDDPRADDQIWIGNGVSGIGKRTAATPGIIMYDSKKVVLNSPESVGLWDTGSGTGEGTQLLVLKLDTASTNMDLGGFYDYVWLTLTELNALVDWKDAADKFCYPLAWVSVASITLPKDEDEDEPEVTIRRVSSMRWMTTEWFIEGHAEPKWAFGVTTSGNTCSIAAGTVRVEIGGRVAMVGVDAVIGAAATSFIGVEITIPYTNSGTITAEFTYTTGTFITFSSGSATVIWPLALLSSAGGRLQVTSILHRGNINIPGLWGTLVSYTDSKPKFLIDAQANLGEYESATHALVLAEKTTSTDEKIRLFLTPAEHSIVDQRENVGEGFGVFKGYNPETEKYEYWRVHSVDGTGITITETDDGIELGYDASEFPLENVGGGAEVYKGFDDSEGAHQLRTIVGGDYVKVTENDDTISVGVVSEITDTAGEVYSVPAGYGLLADGDGGVYWSLHDHDFYVSLSPDRQSVTVRSGTVHYHAPTPGGGFVVNSVTTAATAVGAGHVSINVMLGYGGDLSVQIVNDTLPYVYEISAGVVKYAMPLALIGSDAAGLTIERVYHCGPLYFPSPFSVVIDTDDEGPKYLIDCFEDVVDDPGFIEGYDGKITVQKIPGEAGKLIKLYMTRADHATVDERINIGDGIGVYARYNEDDEVFEYYSLVALEGVHIVREAMPGNIKFEAKHEHADTAGVDVLYWDEDASAYIHYRIDGYGPLQVDGATAQEPIIVKIVSTDTAQYMALVADGTGGVEWGYARVQIENLGSGQGEVFVQYLEDTNTHQLRSLMQGPGVQISQNATEILIEADFNNIGTGQGDVFAGFDETARKTNLRRLAHGEGVKISQDTDTITIEAKHEPADSTGVVTLEWDSEKRAYVHYRIDGYGPLEVTGGGAETPIDVRIVSTGQTEGAALIADGDGGVDWGLVAADLSNSITNIGSGQGEVFAEYDALNNINNLRTLAHGEGVKISQNADTITVESIHVNGGESSLPSAAIVEWVPAARAYRHRRLEAEEGIRLQQLDTNIRVRAQHINGSGLGETFGAWDSTEAAYLHRRIRGENGVKTRTEAGATAPIVIEANIDTTEAGTVKVLSRVVVDTETKQILGYKATLSLAIGENGKLKLTLVEDEEPELIHQGGDCDEEPEE
jgi:hypothetical protein